MTDAPDSAPHSRFRLLLVDGDAEGRAALRQGLEKRFDIVEASTATDALALIEVRWFSIVLTAFELGDRDGVWLLEQVSDRQPLARRVLMSTRGVPNVRGLRDAGIIQLFMAKPVRPETFSAYFKSSA